MSAAGSVRPAPADDCRGSAGVGTARRRDRARHPRRQPQARSIPAAASATAVSAATTRRRRAPAPRPPGVAGSASREESGVGSRCGMRVRSGRWCARCPSTAPAARASTRRPAPRSGAGGRARTPGRRGRRSPRTRGLQQACVHVQLLGRLQDRQTLALARGAQSRADVAPPSSLAMALSRGCDRARPGSAPGRTAGNRAAACARSAARRPGRPAHAQRVRRAAAGPASRVSAEEGIDAPARRRQFAVLELEGRQLEGGLRVTRARSCSAFMNAARASSSRLAARRHTPALV